MRGAQAEARAEAVNAQRAREFVTMARTRLPNLNHAAGPSPVLFVVSLAAYARRAPSCRLLSFRSAGSDISSLAHHRRPCRVRASIAPVHQISHEVRTPINAIAGATALLATTPMSGEQARAPGPARVPRRRTARARSSTPPHPGNPPVEPLPLPTDGVEPS